MSKHWFKVNVKTARYTDEVLVRAADSNAAIERALRSSMHDDWKVLGITTDRIDTIEQREREIANQIAWDERRKAQEAAQHAEELARTES